MMPVTNFLDAEPARECDCPPVIERCAHLGATRLLLSVNVTHCPWHYEYGVMVTDHGPDGVQPCCGMLGWDDALEEPYFGDDYDAALAAFHAAEERLLRGEA